MMPQAIPHLQPLAAILALALALGAPQSTLRANPPVPVNWDLVTDNPNEVLDLSWQGIIVHASGKEDSWIERSLESRFRVNLHPIFMDSFGFGRRRPLLFCAGKIPDVIWDGDPLGVRNNLRNDFILEIPYEVILKNAPTYVKLLNETGRDAWLYSHYKGKNFGLPTFFANANRPQIGGWRLDWLRKVGIEKVPETIEEMHEALYRFRYNDPDGNGLKDTYGWCPAIFHWSVMFAEVFAAFDVLPFDFMEKDGRVVWGGILPETKEALATLHKWYEEGILDPDFVMGMKESENGRKFSSGKVGYTYPLDDPSAYDASTPNTLLSNLREFHPGAEMIPAPPLRNAQGQRRGRTWGGGGHILQFGKPTAKQPEKVLRVLHMLEAIAKDQSLYLAARFGEEGKQWSQTPDRGLELLEPYRSNTRLSKAELIPNTNFYFPSTIDEYEVGTNGTNKILWQEKNRKMEWGMKNVLGKSDVLPSSARYLGDLRNYQVKFFLEVVVGKRPVADFDEFVAEWKRRGGDVLTAEANEANAEMKKIWKRVGADDPAHAGQ